jgi:2-polyprenyl-3-methyl-5-hydroxy-6-metoxy-1,4-benzoquinol methylase
MSVQSYVIDVSSEHTTWDEICLESSGVARIVGWSRRPLAEIEIPTLTVEGNPQTVLNQWRFHRPDIDDLPLAGLAVEWLLQPGPRRFITLEVPGAPKMTLPVRLEVTRPDYAELFDAANVLGREDIYCSGPPYLEIADQVKALIPLMTGRVLDFGCGVGALVKELRGRGQHTSGVEIEREMLQGKLLPEAAPYIQFYDPPILPFGADSFETVTALEVLEHVENIEMALREMSRVASKLIASVPDIGTIPLLHRHGVVPWHLLECTHLNFFTERSFKAVLSQYYGNVQIGRMTPQLVNGTRYFLSLLAICER